MLFKVCGMHGDKAVAKGAEFVQKFNGAALVFGEAFIDFTRLLGDMHVKGHFVLASELGCLLDPFRGYGSDTVSSKSHFYVGVACESFAQGFDILEGVFYFIIAIASLGSLGSLVISAPLVEHTQERDS